MSDDLLTTLRFEVDGSGVATGLKSVKKSIAELGNTVKKITDETNSALGKVGTEELPVAKGLEKASKSIIKQTGDIEKAIATFGSTASTSLKQAYKDINAEEVRLRGMGIDAAIMNPYLEKLREVQKLTAAVAAQERTLAQGAAQAVEAENQRLAHTLELKRQIASVKTTVDNNNAAAQAAKQAEIEAQQKFKLLGLNNQIQAAQKAAADAQAAQSAKAIKDLKDLTAAQAAYRQEVINSELNFTHTGRGKSTAFLADKGQRLGFDSSFIEKELAGYKKVEDAAKAAFQAANPHIAEMSKRAADAGTSVKGLSASMRNVPAQFTDIIVSLQGGQAPLTVLLQQGGQLKDMFGGVGNAARALGGYVVDLINPFTVAAGVVGSLAYVAYKASEDTKAFGKALAETGNRSGASVGQLNDMATAIGATGIGASAASDALTKFVGAGVQAGDNLRSFTQSAIDLERNGGQAVEETAKKFAELAKEPLSATLKLNDGLGYVTQSLYEQIKALERSGDAAGAAALAQGAYEQAIKQQNAALESQRGPIDTATRYWADFFNGIVDGARFATSAILGIPDTGSQQNAKDRAKLAEYEKYYGPNDKDVIALKEKIRVYDHLTAAQKASTQAEKDRQEVLKLSAKYDASDFSNDKLAQRNLLVAENTRLLDAGMISKERYNKRIEDFDKKNEKTVKAAESEYDKLIKKLGSELPKSAAEAEAAQHGYNKAQTEFIALVGGDSWGKFTNDQRATVAALYERKIASEQSEAATKALAKAQADYMEKQGNAGAKEVAALETRLQKQTQHNAEIGKTAEQIEAVRRVAEEAATAELESQAKAIQLLLDKEGGLVDFANTQYTVSEAAKPIYELELKTLRDQIALRKQIAKGYGEGEQKEASAAAAKEAKKAAKDAAKEWQKTADKINDSITDALMRGFENGKGFAENLRDSVVNMFKTMVLRPVVQGAVDTASSGVTSVAGSIATQMGFTASAATLGSTIGAMVASAMASYAIGDAIAGGKKVGGVSGGTLGQLFGGLPGGLVAQLFGKGEELASTGDAIRRYDKGGALTENATNGAWFFTNTQDANKLLDGLESRYQKAAKALGIGTVATQFDYGSNNRGNFALAGAAGNSRANTGEIAYSAEAMQVAASRAVFAALQGSELPKYLSGLLDSVGDINALSQAQIDDVLNTAQAFKGLHDVMVQMPFEALHDLSYNAAKGLIEFSGGLDKLTQNLGTYYDNFYSAEEKKAQTLANITKTLTDAGALTKTTRTAIPGEFDLTTGPTGMSVSLEQRYATSVENLDMPKTREEFRALAESLQDLGGEAAQKAYAALMSVSGAFASVTPAANDAVAALEKDLAARASWQQKLDLLTGKTTEQQIERANDLAGATDAATKALIRQVHAQQDLAKLAAANASIQGSKTQIYNVENAIAPERAALTAAQEAWAGSIKAIKDIAINSFGQSQSDVAKWGAADIEGFKVEDFADSEFFDAVQQALTDYWADKAALVTANDTFAKAEAAAKDAAAKAAIDGHHNGLTQANQIRDAELALKARLYELTGDAGKLADVVKEQRDIIAAGLSTTQADLQRQIWAAEDKAALTGGAGKDILAERNSLQAELNALTDTAAQALARQRDALDESNRALFDNIQATKTSKAIAEQATTLQDRLAIATGASTATEISRKNELATALDAGNKATLLAIYAAEDFATANEKAAATAKQLADEMAAAAKQLADTNKQWQDKLDILTGAQTERSIALRDATDASTRALMRQVYAQQDLKTAVDTSVTNSDNALSGIQKALDAQMQASTKARDAVKGVFDLLKAEIDNLYGQVASTVSMAAIEGQAYIDTALALFKAGGTVPDQDKLGKAIAAVQGGFGNEATQFEADRNRLLLAGKLGQLQDLAGPQLTTAEQQLATTNSAYETAKAQLDTLRGIDTRVLSVAEAVEAFQVAFTGEQTARQKLLASSAQQATAIGGRSQGDADSDPGNIAATKNWAAGRIDNLVAFAAGGGNLDVPRIASEIAALQQYIVSGTTQNLPSFAVGTDYVPHDMIAQIHKGEQIVPAAFNPARYQNSNNDALVAEIKALREEVKTMRENNDAGLQAVASNTMQTAKIQKRWDGDGIPAERTTT